MWCAVQLQNLAVDMVPNYYGAELNSRSGSPILLLVNFCFAFEVMPIKP